MRLYLDATTTPSEYFDAIVKSYDEAINFVENNGIPTFISFNHHLDSNYTEYSTKSGYDFAKWLVAMDIDNIYKFPIDFSFVIHGGDYVEKHHIETILNNYLHYNIIHNDSY